MTPSSPASSPARRVPSGLPPGGPIAADDTPDRLYDLLPAIVRLRDEAQGFPLRDLLRVIDEQVTVVEADLGQLYANWFIETAADWVVPYLGDLVGYLPVSQAGETATAAPAQVRVLVPRPEVADTIRAHRRKGTLALLDQLAVDVAGWPGRAVEFLRLLSVVQTVHHVRLDRGRVLDVHDVDVLDRLGGPFESSAHVVDVRRISSVHRRGRYNIPDVGVFVWRLRGYPVTWAPAACIEEVSPSCFTFDVLGSDAPLFAAAPAPDQTTIPSEADLPVPIRRRALAGAVETYYGPGASFAIQVGVRDRGRIRRRPVPASELVVADLGGWTSRPARGTVAVDPVRGRLAFPPGRPPHGVWVSYRYGFSGDVGAGQYPRRLAAPGSGTFYQAVRKRVAGDQAPTDGSVDSVDDALRRWRAVRGTQPTAVIEILDSEVYSEQLEITVSRGESLEIRAADRTRPVLYLLDRQRNAPDSLIIRSDQPDDAGEPAADGAAAADPRDDDPTPPDHDHDTADARGTANADSTGDDHGTADAPGTGDDHSTAEDDGAEYHATDDHGSAEDDTQAGDGGPGTGPVRGPGGCVRLDGLLVTGRAVHVEGPLQRVEIRHCTLVPGWGLQADCEPRRPAEPSLEVYRTSADIRIHRSILGSIEVYQDEDAADPVPITLDDSILDATGHDRAAVQAPDGRLAYAAVSLRDATVLGRVSVAVLPLVDNSIVTGRVRVARRQIGCVRYSSIPPGSRTPPRHQCQPDLVEASIRAQPGFATLSAADQAALLAPERLRVDPTFTSHRYGTPGYAQLSGHCAVEIVRGADDESEMGVFHDLFGPQRLANLTTRLQQFTPARTDIAVLAAD